MWKSSIARCCGKWILVECLIWRLVGKRVLHLHLWRLSPSLHKLQKQPPFSTPSQSAISRPSSSETRWSSNTTSKKSSTTPISILPFARGVPTPTRNMTQTGRQNTILETLATTSLAGSDVVRPMTRYCSGSRTSRSITLLSQRW